jgi:Clathrin light chain
MARRKKSTNPTSSRDLCQEEGRNYGTSQKGYRRLLRELQQSKGKINRTDEVLALFLTSNEIRKEEAEFLDSRDAPSGGTAWERISKYVDISEKSAAGSGPTRYRELLLSLKGDSNAPSAGA